MALPKAKTDFDLDLDNRLDYERTKLRFAQRVEYRRRYNEVLREVKAEIEDNELRTVDDNGRLQTPPPALGDGSV